VIENLSLAERRVYREALSDKSRKEIARDLHLSLSAVAWHLNRMYKKLGCSGRLDLILKSQTEEQ
jgi:DNA-binding CsgD family transcriptional regulator